MTPQRVARVLWRRKLVCSVVAVIVLAAGTGWFLTRPKVYQSTSSVALLPDTANAGVLPNYPNLIASLIPTYVQLISSPVLLDRVAGSLPFAISGTQLANDVHAESLSNAAVINIVAASPNAIRAQEIAAAATTAFLTEIRGNGVVVPQIYGRPMLPDKPAAASIKLVLTAILALAVILGLAAGLVWDRLFAHVNGAGELAEIHEDALAPARDNPRVG
jgi:capsular polysaccharide biosynthesis protein